MLCIFCENDYEENSFSLEHVIPQFLGGAFAPDLFKTNRVCKKCNSNLGLFVDGAFARNNLVFLELADIATRWKKVLGSEAHPYKCLGILCENTEKIIDDKKVEHIIPAHFPHQEEGDIVELWMGPSGEKAFLIRPQEERFITYAGGNPRDMKKANSTAYIYFVEACQQDINLTLSSAIKLFEGQKTRKILCAELDFDPAPLGFSKPEQADVDRMAFFGGMNNRYQLRMTIDMEYDLRFIAKCALGIGFCLLGDGFLKTEYSNELRKAAWHRKGNEIPKFRGISTLTSLEDSDPELGIAGATVVHVMLVEDSGLVLRLIINNKIGFLALMSPISDLTEEQICKYQAGMSIILFHQKQKSISMTFEEFFAFMVGEFDCNDLSSIQKEYAT